MLEYPRTWPGHDRRGLIHGAVAQLGERCVRNAEVGSSILLRSTNSTSQNIQQHPEARVTAGFFIGFYSSKGQHLP